MADTALSDRRAYVSRRHPVMVVPYRPDIAALTPQARRGTIGSEDVLVIPHDIDHTRLLRNVGVEVTSPILTRYDWAGNKPFKVQRATAAMLVENPEAFVLSDLGTGKTRSVLFAFDYLKSIGKVRRMLVVAPLSTLTHTWLAEVRQHLPHLSAQVIRGSRDEARALMKHWRWDIGIINHDGVTHRQHELDTVLWDVMVFDELTAFKNATASRSRAAQKLAERALYRWGLTGTPTPQGPTDAFGQIKLIRPSQMAMTFRRWEALVTEKVSTFKRVPRKHAPELVYQRMQPAVRFHRSDVMELPPCQHLWRSSAMSREQRQAFEQMARDMKAQVQGAEVTAANAGAKLMKLLQVSAGFLYTEDGKTVDLKGKDRANVVLDLLNEAHAKFIVLSPFIAGVRMLHHHIEKAGYTVGVVSGATTDAQRNEIFSRFKSEAGFDGIIAHPKTMSHGLTLTEADLLVWASPHPSLETYLQANGRITRPGQTRSHMIAHVSGSWVEEKIYKGLQANRNMQNALLELFGFDKGA